MLKTKILVLNWKRTICSTKATALLNLFDTGFPKKLVFLAWSPTLWSLFDNYRFKGGLSNPQLIAQNFEGWSFEVYFQHLTKRFANRHTPLAGVLLNHPEQPETPSEQLQILQLVNTYHQRIFYCFGNQIDLQKPLSYLQSELATELTNLTPMIGKMARGVLVFEPLAHNPRSTMVRQWYNKINCLNRFIRQWLFQHFGPNRILLFGGGLNLTNRALLTDFNGFIIGKNSVNIPMAQQMIHDEL